MAEIHLGIFFDGTNNSRFYDEEHPDADSGETNVSKMYDLYGPGAAPDVITDKIYISGTGTDLGWETSTQRILEGSADTLSITHISTTAEMTAITDPDYDAIDGGTGNSVQDRIDVALAFVEAYAKANPDADIVLDPTGFSRGGVTGMAFVNLTFPPRIGP